MVDNKEFNRKLSEFIEDPDEDAKWFVESGGLFGMRINPVESKLHVDIGLIDGIRRRYIDAVKVTTPRNLIKFMRRIIWNEMMNGDAIDDAEAVMLLHQDGYM